MNFTTLWQAAETDLKTQKRSNNTLASGGRRLVSRLRGRKTYVSNYRDYDDMKHSYYVHGLYSLRDDGYLDYAEKDWGKGEKLLNYHKK